MSAIGSDVWGVVVLAGLSTRCEMCRNVMLCEMCENMMCCEICDVKWNAIRFRSR